jgi:hypothetical protein
MLDILIKLVDKIWWPAFIIFILTLILVIFVVYKIWWFKEKITIVDKVDNAINSINTNMSEIKWTVNHILSRIGTLESGRFAITQSPTKLTDKWTKLLDVTIKNTIDNKREEIKNYYNKFIWLNNPFDIEEYCKQIAIEIFEKFTTNSEKDKIKNELFKEWATLWNLETITWVYVRDKILNEKNIII